MVMDGGAPALHTTITALCMSGQNPIVKSVLLLLYMYVCVFCDILPAETLFFFHIFYCKNAQNLQFFNNQYGFLNQTSMLFSSVLINFHHSCIQARYNP